LMQQSAAQSIKTPIAGFRVIESHVRSFIIGSFVPQRARVLDLVCGPGGLEIGKWSRSKIDFLCCTDPSQANVDQARARWEAKGRPFDAEFHVVRPYEELIEQRRVFDNYTVDVVASFHGVPGAFRDEPTAQRFLRNVSARLRVGGVLFGTMPDSAALWTYYLHLHQELRNAQVHQKGGSAGSSKTAPPSSGPLFFDVDIPSWDNSKPLDVFGSQFEIVLLGEEERIRETLVHFPTLIRLAREENLELLDVTSYAAWYEEHSQGPVRQELLSIYGAGLTATSDRDKDRELKERLKPQLEMCSLFSWFLFRKVPSGA